MSRTLFVLPAMIIMTASLQAATDLNDLSPKDKLALAAKLAPSLVRVEYTLCYDQADPPHVYGWQPDGPDGTDLLRDQRPLERAGYLIAPDMVITQDIIIESRFIESIKVRQGKQVVAATQEAYGKTGRRLKLRLAKPLEGATPLAFDRKLKSAYLVSYGRPGGLWTISVFPFDATAYRTDAGIEYSRAGEGVIITAEGKPVGLCVDRELPVDDSWKGSPADWPTISREDMARLQERTVALADKSILLAHLNFRSPKAHSSRHDGEEKNTTELFCHAVLVDSNCVLVLAELRPEVTARLERIAIELPGGKSVPARFSTTLRYYGGFLATLDSPVADRAPLSAADITSFRGRLLPAADVAVRGSTKITHFCRVRFFSFVSGFRGCLYPGREDSPESFIFDEAGSLIALPVTIRQNFEGPGASRGNGPRLLATSDLKAVLADLAANTDASNMPLPEESENRLAWLGVELQPLDSDLARANNVSHLTNEGQTGALVSYVYPDSPAAAAGIQAGVVLLRIRIADRPVPIDINLQREDNFSGNFPWDRLDEVPEQYFDEIPTPWPGADNALNRTLTDIGFGKKFTIEYVQSGKTLTKELAVTASPMYYDSAPRYQSAVLGLTVRDLTYEVRRYFQRMASDPGVIVTKIEPGSRASVAGVRPYEIITHVNDKPVMTAKDFENLTKDQKELRLSVKRMLRGRVVKLSLEAMTSTDPNAPLIFRPEQQ